MAPHESVPEPGENAPGGQKFGVFKQNTPTPARYLLPRLAAKYQNEINSRKDFASLAGTP